MMVARIASCAASGKVSRRWRGWERRSRPGRRGRRGREVGVLGEAVGRLGIGRAGGERRADLGERRLALGAGEGGLGLGLDLGDARLGGGDLAGGGGGDLLEAAGERADLAGELAHLGAQALEVGLVDVDLGGDALDVVDAGELLAQGGERGLLAVERGFEPGEPLAAAGAFERAELLGERVDALADAGLDLGEAGVEGRGVRGRLRRCGELGTQGGDLGVGLGFEGRDAGFGGVLAGREPGGDRRHARRQVRREAWRAPEREGAAGDQQDEPGEHPGGEGAAAGLVVVGSSWSWASLHGCRGMGIGGRRRGGVAIGVGSDADGRAGVERVGGRRRERVALVRRREVGAGLGRARVEGARVGRGGVGPGCGRVDCCRVGWTLVGAFVGRTGRPGGGVQRPIRLVAAGGSPVLHRPSIPALAPEGPSPGRDTRRRVVREQVASPAALERRSEAGEGRQHGLARGAIGDAPGGRG
jgi:hypothetical protein